MTVEDTVTFTYDAQGLKTSATDGDSALAWSYDGANRVRTAETIAAPGAVQPAVVLTHTYDAVGNRTGLTHGPDAVTVDGAWSFAHDGNGSLTRVTMPTMESIDLVYDAARRLERVTSANTVVTQVLYDALTGRPDRIAHSLGAATLAGFDYGFDIDGKITSIADAGGTRDFTYDATLQLTGGGYASAPETYAYDPEGNRTASHLSASHVHDIANRLREDDSTCYGYDANGNLTSKRVKVGPDCTDTSGATITYTWDVLNRLVRIDKPDGTHAAYRYDAQGRRIGKDVDGALTRYVYDGDAILLEYDGTNTLLATYSHGEEIDQPLAMTRGGASYFYHTDHLGSVRLLTDPGGGVVSRYDYDAFGNLEPTSFEGVANPFAFTARERDAESGLMFYRARYYDPRIGRFISEDPIGFAAGDLNIYRYVANEPLSWLDPFGLATQSQDAALTTFLAANQAAGLSLIGALLACTFTTIADTIAESVGYNLVDGLCAGPKGGIALYNSPPGSDGSSSSGTGSSSAGSPGDPDDDCKPRFKFNFKGLFVGAVMLTRAVLSPLGPWAENPNPAPGPQQQTTVERERRPRPGCRSDPP